MFPRNPPAMAGHAGPDRGDVAPINPIEIMARPRNSSPTSRESLDALLDWRARNLSDDPASMESLGRSTEAFDRLLRWYCRRPQGSAVDPEEAIQEAWLVFLSREIKARDGRDPVEFLAHLLTAVRNRLADLERYHRRRSAGSLIDAESNQLVGREADPAVSHERGRIVTLIRTVLDEARGNAPDSGHRIVMLRWIEGRTYAEVAETLEMPVERVRDRHRRALCILRESIIRRFGSDPTELLATYLEGDRLDPKFEEVTP